LESWSIEEIRQLIKEIEAELRHCRAPPRCALPVAPGTTLASTAPKALTARADHPATRPLQVARTLVRNGFTEARARSISI